MSLYNAFGDKRALFARNIIGCSIDDRERKGCFLVNSALEMAPHHREVAVIITEQLGEVGAFSEGV
jgi:TetR/AcrR family transcriptional regulator, transcriptional repressor for nem operon